MSTTAKTPTKSKAKTTKKVTNAAKKPRAYPSYHEMVKEAILALKERTGSSQIAITKYIEEKQKNLPANFKKLLLVQLRKLVADGRLVKVKNSYKVPSKTTSSTAAPADKPAKKPVKKADPKPKAAEPKKRKAETVKKAKKPTKAAPAKSPAKKKVKTPVKAAKKPKSIKSPAKGAKKAKKA